MRILIAIAFMICAFGCGSSTNGCDGAQLAGNCNAPQAGQCVEFTGLSTNDQKSVPNFCTVNGGAFGATACATAGRVGTCVIPANSTGTQISCSPSAAVTIRYFPPKYPDAASAKAICDTVAGSVFTAG